MPEGTKVGDVYVEGRLEYDEKNTPAFFAAMQRDVRRRLPDVTGSIRQHFDTEMTKTGDSAGKNLSTSLRRSLDRLDLRLPDLDLDVQGALNDIDRVQRELDEIARANPTANVRIDTATARAEIERLKRSIEGSNLHMEVEVDVDNDMLQRNLGTKVRSALRSAFTPDEAMTTELVSTIRTGVSRGLVSMIASPAGLAIGTALVAMLGQAIVAGTVFLGAALTGALIGGLGIGAIAAGIALVADDPKIGAAADKIGNKLMTGLKEAAKPFRDEVVQSLGILEGTVDKIMPRISTIFADLSTHVVPLTQAVDKFVTNAMPGIQAVLTTLDPVIGSLTQGIERLGTKISEAFSKFADPLVMQGAAQALEDLIGILGELIVLTAEFFATLSKAYLELRPHLAELKEALKSIGIDGQFVKDVFGLIGTIILGQLIGGITNLTLLCKGLAAAWDAIKVAATAVAEWFQNTIWPSLQTAGQQAQGIWDAVASRWNAIWADIKADWASFKDAINAGVAEIKQAWEDLRNSINAIVGEIKTAWNDLKTDFTTGKDEIKSAWADLKTDLATGKDEIKVAWSDLRADIDSLVLKFNELRDRVREAWENIRSTVTDVVNQLRNDVAAGWENIRSTVTDRVNAIRDAVRSGWEEIRRTVTDVINQLRNDVSSGFDEIRNRVTEAMNQIRDSIRDRWNEVRGIFDQIISHIQGAVTNAWNSLRDVIRNTWNENLTNIRNAWNQIRDTVFNEINARTDDLKARFQQLKDQLTARFNEIRDTFRNVWNEIRTQIFDPMGDMVANQLPAKYTEFKDKVIRIFSEVRDTIGRIWNEMINAAKGAVNTLGGFINNVIRAINKIPFMKDKLPELPGFADGGAVPGKAKGGHISGGPRGTDTVPAMGRWGQPFLLDNGEHVLTKDDVRRMGGQNSVYNFRKALHRSRWPSKFEFGGPIRKAVGGRVGPQNEGLLNEHRDHVHVAMNVPPMGFPAIIAAAKASGIPHQVGSTFRPGSRGSSGGLDHHSAGRAVDFPGFNQDRFASFWEGLPGVIELIHRTASRDYAIFGGGGGGVSGVISWLLSEAGKAVKAAFDKAMGELKGFIGGDLLKGDNVAPGIMRNMFDNVAGQLASFFDFNASAGGGAAAPEQLRKWIEEAQKYVTIEDIGKLVTLIMRESGGNPRAINLTDSNAQKGTPSKGLMQTIDPTFQAYRDPRLPNDPYDPVANIVAGMNYIHARYGSLNNVQQANANAAPRGYEHGGEISAVRVAMDRAGVIPSGSEAFIKNATSETEFAMTASHMQKLFGRDDPYASDVGSTVNVYVDGVRRDARIEVQKNAKKVAGALRAGGRA